MEFSHSLQAFRNIDRKHRHYRFHLTGADDRIAAAESFFAPGDADATEIAGAFCEACSDAFPNYELWQGRTPIVAARHTSKGSLNLNAVAALQEHRDAIVDLEERLQKGFACVRRSRKLLHRHAQVRRPRS